MNGRIDWTTIAHACGIEGELTADLKKQLRLGLDAIIWWLGVPTAIKDMRPAKRKIRSSEPPQHRSATTAPSTRKPRRIGVDEIRPQSGSVPRGPQPKPIQPYPDPLFEASKDPADFRGALVNQMRRFGESCWQLYRAVVRLGETFDDKTLLSWIQGERVPRSVASFGILTRIEQRYRLPPEYFKAKLPHQSRSLQGHDFGDMSPAERRRIAVHLPDDFSSLPFTKREEILDWVRRVIVSGSTDYRRYQAAAVKQRYAIRFPGVTYGGGSLSPRVHTLTVSTNYSVAETSEDPDLLSGVRCAAAAGDRNGRSDPVQDIHSYGDRLSAKRGLGGGNRVAENRAPGSDVRCARRLACRRRKGAWRAAQSTDLWPADLPGHLGLVSAMPHSQILCSQC